MSYTIEDIARIIGARRIGDRPAAIDWLLTDSRSLSFPEETLFFALPTKRNDGTRYIRDLYARGVRNFVVSEERLNEVGIGEPKVEDAARQETVDTAAMQPAFNLLVVPNPLKALQKLAEQHRDRFQIPVIGITGSNGKTIVKEWLHQLLSPERMITRSPRSYNSQIGVPLSVWQMSEQTELAILGGRYLGTGRNACLTEYYQTYNRYPDKYRRRASGEFLLFAGEMYGEAGSL